MSVALFTPPLLHHFSKETIIAEFDCTNYLQQVGTRSVNRINRIGTTSAGVIANIKYGNVTITMTAATVPDDSGNEFLAYNPGLPTDFNIAIVGFLSNYQLSKDFDITEDGNDLVFTAKKKGIGFDFTEDGINTTPGAAEIKKPNYTVLFRLFLENATHTGFDLVYVTNLQLLNSTPSRAVAQIGDKLHQKIFADLDRLGLEIPTTTVIQCKLTSRKYYFEFAESYGETITVKKLHRSSTFNVIYGDLSYQAKQSQTVTGLLAPSTPPLDRFLKQGSTVQSLRIDQPQFLYFYNTRATQLGAKLIVRHFFDDGTEGQETLHTFTLTQFAKYAFNISYGSAYNGVKKLERFAIWLTDTDDLRISEKQEFYIDYEFENYPRYFLNWSSWGALDSRFFYGQGQQSLARTFKTAEKILNKTYALQEGQSKIYDLTGVNKFKATTGFKDPQEILQNQDFFLSALVFRYLHGAIMPIVITSNEIENPEDGNKLHAHSFDYQYRFKESAYTETDQIDTVLIPGAGLGPKPIQPVIIYAGTPANPSTNIIQQQIL